MEEKQEQIKIEKGDRIRIYGSMFPQHNTTGTVISVYHDAIDGTYGIEFTADYGGYEYWKQWTDGGWVEKL